MLSVNHWVIETDCSDDGCGQSLLNCFENKVAFVNNWSGYVMSNQHTHHGYAIYSALVYKCEPDSNK